MNPEKLNAKEQLENYIRLLSEAHSLGYEIFFDKDSSLSFSPVKSLLETTIDNCLLLGQLFDIGSQGPRLNQGLFFSERFSDSLGNPKQIRINFRREQFWDPRGKEIFHELAQAFIKIKRKKSIRQSFHDFAMALDLIPQKSSNTRQGNNKNQASYFYWRRHHRVKKSR